MCIRGAFTPTEVELVERGIERNLADPSPRALVASRADDSGRFVEDFCNWDRIEEYEQVIRESAAAAIAGRLMGAATVRLYHDHMLVKEAGTRQPTPWHQDQPYYNVDGRRRARCGCPSTRCRAGRRSSFVAGSHLGPWLMPRTFMDGQARWFPEGSLADLPDIEADRSAFPIVGWALEPATPSSSTCSRSTRPAALTARRRAFSIRFLGDDAVHAPRAWKTSPEFPGLSDALPAGAPMDDPRFPVVWRA